MHTIPSQICQEYDVNSFIPLALFWKLNDFWISRGYFYQNNFWVFMDIMQNISQFAIFKQHQRDEFTRNVSIHTENNIASTLLFDNTWRYADYIRVSSLFQFPWRTPFDLIQRHDRVGVLLLPRLFILQSHTKNSYLTDIFRFGWIQLHFNALIYFK